MPSCLWCERRPSRPRGWYCSDECKREATRVWQRVRAARRAPPKPPCRACGGPIAHRGAHWYCSPACREWARAERYARYAATAKGKARYARYNAKRRQRRDVRAAA